MKAFHCDFSWQFYYSCLQIYFEINKYNATVYIVLEYIKRATNFFSLLHSCCTDGKYNLTYK